MRWGAASKPAPQSGVVETLRVELSNEGTVPWNDQVKLAYHWLDDRDNPIVWDGPRTDVPHLSPGEAATVELDVRGPMPPGPYRLALDMVAEHRAWFSELGSPMLSLDLEVAPRSGEPRADLPPNVAPADDWAERVRAAHAEGYGVVAGAIGWNGGRRPRSLSEYTPGPGRLPRFTGALLVPSVLPGIELERLDDVEGLPAYAAPRDEPWIYDGRIVLTVRPQSGRRPG
ncbi:MAG: hypothetical protein JWO17_610 [Actinomycetia bacterium]|nr:hypothetical protein [Actinomycetes bacterium]